MATTTKNLGLVKPDYTDAADIAVINSNMDVLDDAVAGLQESIVTDDQLSQEVQQALKAAKDSGEFDGPKGDNGTSPTVSTSKNGEVTTIIITDVEGTKTATINDGKDGFSPVATVEQTDDGAIIRITDESGTTTVAVTNGKDGENGYTPVKGVDYFDGEKGDSGVSPTVTVSKNGKVTTLTIKDENGTKTATISDGADGYTPVKGVDYFDGEPGVSPTVTTSKSGKVTTITIKDANGTKTATISDGKDGSNGVSATHSWSGTTLTITSASGTSSANLKGEKGDAGKTPVAGIDYFTPAEKAEFVQVVIAALPVYSGEVV